MDRVFAFVLANSQVAGLVLTTVGVSVTVASYLAARRERKLKKYEAIPEVRATINKDNYPGGWRSVQLHVVPRKQHQQFQFNYHDWCIERVRLLRPWRAVLARAENDDYATAVF